MGHFFVAENINFRYFKIRRLLRIKMNTFTNEILATSCSMKRSPKWIINQYIERKKMKPKIDIIATHFAITKQSRRYLYHWEGTVGRNISSSRFPIEGKSASS